MDRAPINAPINAPGTVPGTAPGTGADTAAGHPHRAIIALLPELRGFARFLARERGEADDLVQDALVRALAAFDQFRPGTNLRAWLFTILRNTYYEHNRRRRTERAAIEHSTSLDGAHSASQESHSTLSELQRRLWELPPLLREALVLVGAQELSYEEAAAICNVPIGTMKARVSRARSQLARLVGRSDATADA